MGEQWAVAPVVDGRAVWPGVATVCHVCGAQGRPTLAAYVDTLQARLDEQTAEVKVLRDERDEARTEVARLTADLGKARARAAACGESDRKVRRLRQQLARQRQVVADGLAWLLDLPVIRRQHVQQLQHAWFGGGRK